MIQSINHYAEETINMTPHYSSIHALGDEQKSSTPIVKLKLNIYNTLKACFIIN